MEIVPFDKSQLQNPDCKKLPARKNPEPHLLRWLVYALKILSIAYQAIPSSEGAFGLQISFLIRNMS